MNTKKITISIIALITALAAVGIQVFNNSNISNTSVFQYSEDKELGEKIDNNLIAYFSPTPYPGQCTEDYDCRYDRCSNCESGHESCFGGECVECIYDRHCEDGYKCVNKECVDSWEKSPVIIASPSPSASTLTIDSSLICNDANLKADYEFYNYSKTSSECTQYSKIENSDKYTIKCNSDRAEWRGFWVKTMNVEKNKDYYIYSTLNLTDDREIFDQGGVDTDNSVELIVLSENPNSKLLNECSGTASDVNQWQKCQITRADFEFLGSCGIPKYSTEKNCEIKFNSGENENIYFVFKVTDYGLSLIEGSLSNLKVCNKLLENTHSPFPSVLETPSPVIYPSPTISSAPQNTSIPTFSGLISSSVQNTMKCAEKYNYQNQESPYIDLTKYHWAYNYIMYLTKKQAVSGYFDGSFRANNNITRAELLKIALKAYNKKIFNIDYSKEFSDVSQEDWFSQYVNYGIRNNIIEGYPDNSFRPDNYVTRAEAIKIILLASGINIPATIEKADFFDTPKHAWYTKYLVFLANHGIIQGYNDNMFKPDKPISRAEAVKIIQLIDDIYITPCIYSQ